MAHERTTFFTIDRKLLESEWWVSEPFTKPQAWIDLIGMANYNDVKRMEGDQMVTYSRGSVVTSVRTLANRWHWSQEKVRNYLAALESDSMASAKKSARGIVIVLENYAFYQDIRRKTERKTENRPSSDRAVTEHSPRQKNNITNITNHNKEREGATPRGPYGHLALTDGELDLFRGKYPEAADRFIAEMDEYMDSTGKEYANHYTALLRWARNDSKYAGKAGGYKTGFEKVKEEIENGTFTF